MAVHDMITQAELEEVLESHDLLVVDFWAPWCPPCKAFAPLFEAAAERHPDAAFCRVNTQEEEELSGPFDVDHIPTLVVIRERVMVASQPGYLEADQLDALLRQVRELDMDAIRGDAQVEGREEESSG
jgi:thioredoxin 1